MHRYRRLRQFVFCEARRISYVAVACHAIQRLFLRQLGGTVRSAISEPTAHLFAAEHPNYGWRRAMGAGDSMK